MEIKLTQYSKGSGCGCKIEPSKLKEILQTTSSYFYDERILVGNNTNDDAAVFDMRNDTALISTSDFFTPIVDDAFDFGYIAAANAISDVYAMGGNPVLAIALLGWPIQKLPTELAQQVLEGARACCHKAGISLAGGHSIDSSEPFFGLAVNGFIKKNNIKKNNTAQAGDVLYLSKKIGTGILSTAEKRNLLKEEHRPVLIEQMKELNSLGKLLGNYECVTAMTDITGFGLLGHLIEMAEGSGLQANIDYNSIALLDGISDYIAKICIPDNTYRNWNSYEKKTVGINAESLYTLCDPQTNGGLLFSVKQNEKNKIEELLKKEGYDTITNPIGFLENGDKNTIVKIR